jgi:hypothetical protein
MLSKDGFGKLKVVLELAQESERTARVAKRTAQMFFSSLSSLRRITISHK